MLNTPVIHTEVRKIKPHIVDRHWGVKLLSSLLAQPAKQGDAAWSGTWR